MTRQITRKSIAGRDIYVCDNFVDEAMATRIGQMLPSLHYLRKESSRPGTPVSGAVSDISPQMLASEPFFSEMRRFGEEMFAGEKFDLERVYVNSAVYGDVYFPHRDCLANLNNITVLYYGNLVWHSDWGGETVFYNENLDAEVVVSPRPNRVLVSRGAIPHRGGVPSRICHQERYTIAYKLKSV
jgi:hypothetical protein